MSFAPIDERVAFIVAGVQKGGTTALFDYLGDEPGLALSRDKEVHFFDNEAREWSAADYADYHEAFPPFDGRPRGEATPIYVYWRDSLARIAAYNPAMRLILVLRDPVQRAWSHWRMEYARGAERQPFAWCIRQGRARLFDAEPWGFHREFSYVERGYYGEQIAHALTLFPRDRLLVLRAEDLRADPAPALAAVRAFLGLPPGAPPRQRDVHVGAEMDYGAELNAEDVTHLRRLYDRDQDRLRDLVGFRYG